MDHNLSFVLSGITTRLGSEKLSAADLSAQYSAGQDDPTSATGITALHRFAPEENLLDVSAECIREALTRSGLSLRDVGGLVATSNFTHETLSPTFSVAIAARAGLASIHAGTIGTGCGGLAQAVEHAASMMTSPFMGWDTKKVFVIVAGDAYSRHIDPKDYKTRYLFSEGVAVFILRFTRAKKGDLVVSRVTSRSLVVDEPLEALTLGNPAFVEDRYFRMQTAPVVRFTRKALDIAKEMLGIGSWNGVTIIPHQANARLLVEMRKTVPEAHLFYTNGIASVGNTLNASSVFGLEDVLTNDTASDDIVLVPFGAEWVVGVIQLRRQQ
jgi:3-oxoacyl-[acyl-carrier-protein] synthase III